MSDKKRKNKKHSKNELVKKDKKKFSAKHPKITVALRILLLLIIMIAVVGTGIVVGMLYGGWGDDFEITKEELVIGSSNSVVLDKDGNKLAELSGDENRKIIKLDQMPENLKNAYVAIEDERFYKHNGVDFKRTAAAVAQYVIHAGKSSFGGSTITQQLVKNITKDDERSGKEGVIRKVKEWAKAYQIERMLSKDQILELYLNIIFVGGSNNLGVEVGAEYYFNKSASDLDLAECAFLAGINNSPNSYNPYGEKDKSELIKKRTKTVLGKMLELGMVQQNEYDEAVKKVEDGLPFQKAENLGSIYSYHTDATISQVIEDVAKEKGISKSLASTYVYSSGLTIYSTQDTALQSKMDEVMVNKSKDYIRKSKKVDGATSQSAMVIIDNSTGYVVGVEGGLGEKNESRGLNRATQSPRQTGSSIKPLTSLVPGINEGVITPATIYDDNSTDFGIKGWTPKDYNAFKGLISIRSAITTSQNIPFIKVVDELTPAKSAEYLEKMGVTSLTDADKQALAAVSIGGFTNGITPLEMAGAYATIANNGTYRRPMFYTKVTDPDGNTVLEGKQDSQEVISEQAAYVIKSLLKSVVEDSAGTAKYCKISGIDVAAKTGTTNSNYDKWLCGFSNYYTAATWYGFDQNEEVSGATNVAGRIWSAVMSKVHEGKDKSTFNQPSGVVTETICRVSGKKATSKCSDTYQEVFVEGKVPEDCDGHSNSVEVCSETGLLANEFCPNKVTKYHSYTVEKERLGLWKTNGSSSTSAPTTYCTVHNASNSGKSNNKNNDSEPVITLNGESHITLNVGDTYSEQGATAKDDKDGDISSKISMSGSVNTSKAGKYTITYSVKNSNGKTATKTRTITVKAKEPVKEPEKPAENTTGNDSKNTTTEKENTAGPGNTTPTTENKTNE
ncbi:MAG: transglycosylase domain-containing protein [Clostridia bacterium]